MTGVVGLEFLQAAEFMLLQGRMAFFSMLSL